MHLARRWRDVHQLELATCDWVAWFNTSRLHHSIGGIPPIEYEAAYYAAQTPAA